MSIGVKHQDTTVTFEGTDLTIIDTFGAPALKVEQESNGALSVKFLQKGRWGVGQREFGGERTATVGFPAGPPAKSAAVVTPTKPVIDLDDEDPHVYDRASSNGYTIHESTERALDQVRMDILRLLTIQQKGDIDEMRAFFQQIIYKGYGRNYLYRLAGRAKNVFTLYKTGTVLQLMKDFATADGTYTNP